MSSEDVFGGSYLSPSGSNLSPRKSPSRQNLSLRRSVNSLRGTPSPLDEDKGTLGGGAGNARFSLAHELAVALMPEPSAGSKLLAEEFGIEYDEGAEGIDEEAFSGGHVHGHGGHEEMDSQPSFLESQFGSSNANSSPHGSDEYSYGLPESPLPPKAKEREQDAMEILAQDLESTDLFLLHLRQIDTDGAPSSQPNLERFASDVIRRLNDTARDREGQVRELLGYEREFRKIAGEVGGDDVLAQLDELPQAHVVESSTPEPSRLDDLVEAEEDPASDDWEADHRYHDEEDEDEDEQQPIPAKDAFPPPPPLIGPASASQSIPQLVHLRTFTTSLITSLATISEQAQVNGAATTEAGRKIRALKNKMGGWRTDFDSAEKSRTKIDKWEAGVIEGTEGEFTPSRGSRRIDGRKLVEVQLQEFEKALADAAERTRIIMASS